jgi:hypothetical protein
MLSRNTMFVAAIGISGLVAPAQAQTVIYDSQGHWGSNVYRADYLRAPIGFSAGFSFHDDCYRTRRPVCSSSRAGHRRTICRSARDPFISHSRCDSRERIYRGRSRDCERRRHDYRRRYSRRDCDGGGFSLGFWLGDRDRRDCGRSYYRGREIRRGSSRSHAFQHRSSHRRHHEADHRRGSRHHSSRSDYHRQSSRRRHR